MENENPKNARPFLPIKYDIVFRLFFADERNEDDLVDFLKSILRIPEDEYQSIEIADPHLLPEYLGDKYAVIDVKLHTKTRKVIHIEVQLKIPPSIKNRIVFYDAKLITEQINSGGKYNEIQKVISIIISDEELISNSIKYHHRFTFYDPETAVEFTDIVEIYTIELCKLPENTDGTALYDWAKFIDAETEEELDMVAQRNPQIRRAAVKLRELSTDEKARDMFERREKGLRDVAAMVDGAEQKAKTEIARNLLNRNRPIEEIIEDTGLTREEVERIKITINPSNVN